jgi:hypothetical protein
VETEGPADGMDEGETFNHNNKSNDIIAGDETHHYKRDRYRMEWQAHTSDENGGSITTLRGK